MPDASPSATAGRRCSGYCTLQITNGPGGIAERNLGKHGELLKAKRAEQEERLRRVPVASRPPQPLNPPEKLA